MPLSWNEIIHRAIAFAGFPGATRPDLYDPLAMPPALAAHTALDRAVDKCYRSADFPGTRARVESLFNSTNNSPPRSRRPRLGNPSAPRKPEIEMNPAMKITHTAPFAALRHNRQNLIAAALIGVTAFTATIARAADPLPSWNDGATKQSITSFVGKVTKPGSPDFVPPAERIAVFDNDGTLWSEQPMYFQLRFALDRVKAMAPQHPEWQKQDPFKKLLNTPKEETVAVSEQELMAIIMATHAGMTTEEFEQIVTDWITTARHPKTGRRYTEMVYQPMLEVLAYLRANGFKTFIVSGGGIEFMRPWTEKVYGIPPEQVVGSSGQLKFEMRDNQPVLVKLPELDFIDDKAGKPVGIQRHIGRRPIAAFGNSDGDLQMLQWTAAGKGARFCLYVHHTDAEREWAYDRESHIGKLDQGLDEAKAKGWTVVDMKKDWNRIFP